ncbi:hypothetical protein ACFL6C_00275 [Myxococcota bacterium]
MQAFQTPDWNAPLDIEERLSSVPQDLQVKGLFFGTATREARERSGRAPGRKAYSPLMEGAVIQHFGAATEIGLRTVSLCDVDVRFSWQLPTR